MLTGDPVFTTKTVFLFVAKILFTSASCLPGRLKLFLSFPSVSQSEFVPTTRTTASDCFAALTASSSKLFGSGGLHPNCMAGNLPSNSYSTSTKYSLPLESFILFLFGAHAKPKKASPFF